VCLVHDPAKALNNMYLAKASNPAQLKHLVALLQLSEGLLRLVGIFTRQT
jgi:hypothetical protein